MCQISVITNPDINDAFDLGESVNVTWNTIGTCTGSNAKRVTEIMLQRRIGSAWNNVQSLWTGSDNVTLGSRTVTMPNSVPVYGDVYRVRLEYAAIGGP